MNREELVNEITNFFVKYRVDTSMGIEEMKTIDRIQFERRQLY